MNYVTCSFEDPYSGRKFEAQIQLWPGAGWQLAVEGQWVTVLFFRDNPKRSTVCEFGGYKIQDA